MRPESPTRCGTIVLAGLPNAGKSTLLNAAVGTPLAITSDKPQSTRQRVVGIRTEGPVQLLFVDPPGLLEPHYLLQHTMLEEALEVLGGGDAILHLHRADAAPAPSFATLVPEERLRGRSVATVYTAIDTVPLASRPPASPSVFPISAVTGEGMEALLAWCESRVPIGPFRYAADDLSTQPSRFFVAEFVREAAFELLQQELPYALTAHVDEFREGSDPVYIRVTIYVERASQKGMVIGAGGRTIKALGARARQRIEALLGAAVYLDLWVKVLPHWRKSPQVLQDLGFRLPVRRNA